MQVTIAIRLKTESGQEFEVPFAEAQTLYQQLGSIPGIAPIPTVPLLHAVSPVDAQKPPENVTDAVQSVEVPTTLRKPSLTLQGPTTEVPAG